MGALLRRLLFLFRRHRFEIAPLRTFGVPLTDAASPSTVIAG